MLVSIKKWNKKIDDYEAEIATNKKTIEIINARLQRRDYRRKGDETDEQEYFIDMNMKEETQQKITELKEKKAELIEANGITIKQMEIANDQIKVAAAEKNAAKPQEGSAFLSFF